MKKVYIEDSSYGYTQLFARLGFTITHDFDQADLICFTGGADVTPALYKDKAHKYTGNDEYRDAKEERVFNAALERGIPMVGICRGGQFLNVMSGGRMYQHVTDHGRAHTITDTRTGETVYVSSTHHQMIMPSAKAAIIATAVTGSNREWYDGEVFMKDISEMDIEVVYYEHTKCLCFQPHPEFTSVEYEGMVRYFDGLVKEFLCVPSQS